MYTVLKSFTAGERDWNPGDTLPDGVLLPKALTLYLFNKWIIKIHEDLEKTLIKIPYYIENDEYFAEVKEEDMHSIFRLLQLPPDKKAFDGVLAKINDADILTVLICTDSREGAVKKYQERAQK